MCRAEQEQAQKRSTRADIEVIVKNSSWKKQNICKIKISMITYKFDVLYLIAILTS